MAEPISEIINMTIRGSLLVVALFLAFILGILVAYRQLYIKKIIKTKKGIYTFTPYNPQEQNTK